MAISLPICFEFISVRRPSVECGDEFITLLHNNRRCLVSGGSGPVLGNLCHKTEVLGGVGEDVVLEPFDLCDVLHVGLGYIDGDSIWVVYSILWWGVCMWVDDV